MGGIISADRGTTAAAERHRRPPRAPTRVKTTRRHHHLAPSPPLRPFRFLASPRRLARGCFNSAARSVSCSCERGGRRPLAPGRPLLRDATHPRAVPPRNGPVRRFLNNQPLAHTDWVIYFTYRGFVRIHPNLYLKKTTRSILPNMDATHQQRR